MRPPTAADPAWFRLKNRAYGSALWSFGGELRVRIEDYAPVRAGLRGGEDDQYLLYRALVHAEARVGPGWRLFSQLGWWNEQGRRPRPAPTDVDRGDVAQLFVDWQGEAGAFVRAGRQEVLHGSGRLVGIRHAPNIRLAFDGVRAAAPIGATRVEFYHLRPVALEPGAFDNRENARERVAGLIGSRAIGKTGLIADVYALRYEKPFQAYQNASGSEFRNTLGARIHGNHGRWRFNQELTLQGGRVGTQRVRAWSWQADTQWRPELDGPWVFGLKSSIGSGDADAADGRIETFQPIYAAPPYFMQSSLVYPANLRTLQPYVEWAPTPTLAIGFDAQVNARVETADGWYAPPMVLQALDARGRLLASQWGFWLRHQPRRDLLIEAWASRFEPRGALARAGGRDTVFLSVMATWSY